MNHTGLHTLTAGERVLPVGSSGPGGGKTMNIGVSFLRINARPVPISKIVLLERTLLFEKVFFERMPHVIGEY